MYFIYRLKARVVYLTCEAFSSDNSFFHLRLMSFSFYVVGMFVIAPFIVGLTGYSYLFSFIMMVTCKCTF